MRLALAAVGIAVLAALGLIVLKRVHVAQGRDAVAQAARMADAKTDPAALSPTVERPRVYRSCHFVVRPRAGGVALRNGPGLDQPVRIIVPRDSSGAALQVVGGDRGWFLVQAPPGTGASARPSFAARGWAPGAALAIGFGEETGYARPDADAPVADWRGRYAGTETAAVPVACDGGWVLVEHRRRREQGTARRLAWFRNLCDPARSECAAEVPTR